jgi:O-6-methylguanine DNA methyltransferase
MSDRHLLDDLRALGDVRAPDHLLRAILTEVDGGDRYASLETALGPVFVAWNARGASAVMKTASASEFEARFRERFGREARPVSDVPPLDGGAFDLRGVTEFERAVLLKALEIPRGEVRTYGWIAAQIGRPAAVRAVGSALRKNPLPVLIPCHRVVRGDGHIGEYALGGSDAKRVILAAEGIDAGRLQQLVRSWRTAREDTLAASG